MPKQQTSSGKKIAVIGAGAVGSTVAYTLMLKNLASQIVLIDINDKKEKGEVLDLGDGLCFVETGCIKGGDFPDAADADLIILTAGVAQKPGETRLQLAAKNKAIAKDIFKKIGRLKPSTVVLVVSNPVDVITNNDHLYFTHKISSTSGMTYRVYFYSQDGKYCYTNNQTPLLTASYYNIYFSSLLIPTGYTAEDVLSNLKKIVFVVRYKAYGLSQKDINFYIDDIGITHDII